MREIIIRRPRFQLKRELCARIITSFQAAYMNRFTWAPGSMPDTRIVDSLVEETGLGSAGHTRCAS
jgi:hypothetical protein